MVRELLGGLGGVDLASLIARGTLGLFFVLARFRSFYDPSKPPGCRVFNTDRFGSLQRKLCSCGFSSRLLFWTWVTALVEVAGGLALMAGLLTTMAALGLLILTVRASMCTAWAKISEQNPVDSIDCVACYLWRVEGVYIALALLIMLLGPGNYSLDVLLGVVGGK
jgi:uncharacterized membrane protein YphA (DoxX/SURF4 family)